MKRFWIVFLLLAIVVVGGLALLWQAVDRFAEAPYVPGGVLVWKVEGSYPEVRDDSVVGIIRDGRGLVFRDVVLALERAADDPRIQGLYLDIRNLDSDWAKVDEIRRQIARFRASGKPVLAVLAMAGTKEYAVATAADRVALVPEGALLIFGVSAELLFLKDTLEKVGIAADFVHVGRYKSAPEQLTRTGATEANREMTRAIVDDRYRLLLAAVAEGRGVAIATAAAWIDSGLYDAPAALAAGLVDTVAARAGLSEGFLPTEEITELSAYARERGAEGREGTVAIISVAGTIMPGESRKEAYQGWIAGSKTVSERLDMAAQDDDVDAIVLRVDSPGGSALASDDIGDAVARAREAKPLVVSMSGYAASGGYYISCAADSIFAEPGTLTGSIGVFAGKLDMSGLYGKLDVHREFIAQGRNASFFSGHGGFTTEQRERFQAHLDRFYARFVNRVAEGRGLALDVVHNVAEGRVWTGTQALENGLVDDLGGLPRALVAARRLAGLPEGARVSVQVFERRLSWLERLVVDAVSDLPSLGARPLSGAALPPPLEALRRDLAASGTLALTDLLDGQVVALPPYHLVVR